MITHKIHLLKATTPLLMAGNLAACQQFLAANFHKETITKPEGKLWLNFKPDTINDQQTRITATFSFVYPIDYPYGLQYGVISQIKVLMRIDKSQNIITHADLKQMMRLVLKQASKVCNQLATTLTGAPFKCKFPINQLHWAK